MLQVLPSIDDFERITDIAKTRFDQITLIGYLDKSFKLFEQNDLLLYFGSKTSIHGYGERLLSNIKFYLMTQGLIVKQHNNKLIMFDEVIAEYTQSINENYWFGLILIKLVDGLNDYGIASYEMYKLLLEIANYYLKSNSEKGDK